MNPAADNSGTAPNPMNAISQLRATSPSAREPKPAREPGREHAGLPDLAESVNNHAVQLAEAGRRAEALTTREEAVRLCRELAEANRDAYLPNLANSLRGRGWIYVKVGGPVDDSATTATLEATQIYDELVVALADAFGDRLLAVAHTLAKLYDARGDDAAAADIRDRYKLPVAGS